MSEKNNCYHVVNFSGGLCSWMAAHRVIKKYGTNRVTLLFADTNMEDEGLYLFIQEAEKDLGVSVTRIADGRTPWEVFHDERFLGNSRVDPCSKILKRKLLNRWHKDNCDPTNTIIYVGLSWDEINRFERFAAAMVPWLVQAPLCEPPYLSKLDLIKIAKERGLTPPRLYLAGFPHNNCGGFCIKAGQAQFKLLLKKFPERYLFHEQKEQQLRAYLRKDVSILKDQTGGVTKPLTLEAFRKRVESNQETDMFDWGGCGCAID